MESDIFALGVILFEIMLQKMRLLYEEGELIKTNYKVRTLLIRGAVVLIRGAVPERRDVLVMALGRSFGAVDCEAYKRDLGLTRPNGVAANVSWQWLSISCCWCLPPMQRIILSPC